MYLPWTYDLAMVGGTVLYFLTSIFGYQAWKILLPGGYSPGPLFEFFLYAGSLGLAFPMAMRNIYVSYRDGTGKMFPFVEAIRPMVSFSLALVLFMTWATRSPNDILVKDPRMFFYVSGTICANISCRLIVAQVNLWTSMKTALLPCISCSAYRLKTALFHNFCFSLAVNQPRNSVNLAFNLLFLDEQHPLRAY